MLHNLPVIVFQIYWAFVLAYELCGQIVKDSFIFTDTKNLLALAVVISGHL